MPIDFPNSPTTGDTYSEGAKTWQYNGTSWNLMIGSVSIPTGSIDSAQLALGAVTTGTIAANAVTLGTKTTGDYVASLVAGIGVTLSNNSGESATPTVAIGQAVATNSNVEFASLKITTVREPVTVTATPMSSTVIDIYAKVNPTVYYTLDSTANGTFNIISTSSESLNTFLSSGEMVTVTVMVTNGVTQYRPTTFQIDGNAVTPKWQGGSAPSTGNASSIDAYTLTALKTADATFTLFAAQTRFA